MFNTEFYATQYKFNCFEHKFSVARSEKLLSIGRNAPNVYTEGVVGWGGSSYQAGKQKRPPYPDKESNLTGSLIAQQASILILRRTLYRS